MEYQIVTNPEQSEKLMKAGLCRYSADAYLVKCIRPVRYEPRLVPLAQKQLEMDLYDRFFHVNAADVSRRFVIPAWSLGRLWEICGGANLMPGDDPFGVLTDRIAFLIRSNDIDPKYLD